MFLPGAISGSVFRLLVPEDSILVTQGSDEIRYAVTIHVLDEDESRRPQVELGMKSPRWCTRVRRRLKPAAGGNDVGAAVTVDVARADPVAPAHGAHFVLDPGLSRAIARQLVPSQGEVRF